MSTDSNTRVSIDQIVENIRETRNARITELMAKPALIDFIERHFETVAISPVKVEFLMRDFKQLKADPLDLAYYSSLITHLKSSGLSSPDPGHELFLQEILNIFRKYGFDSPAS